MKKKLKKCCREAVEKLLERIKLEKMFSCFCNKPCKNKWHIAIREGYKTAIRDLEILKQEIKKEKN